MDTNNQYPIRILCVFADLNRGGAESMCMNLYRHIDRDKVQFDFVKHRHEEGAFESEIIALGGHVYEAPHYKYYNTISYRRWWKRHLKDHPEHRIIHFHYYTISFAAEPVIHSMNRILICHCHTYFRVNNVRSFLRYHLIRSSGKNADYSFACSDCAGKMMYGNKPFITVRNAIDADLFRYNEEKRNNIREKYNIGNDCFVVGTVGRFYYPKNPSGIIDIFEAYNHRYHNSKLLWVGDGELRADIERQISERNLNDSIILTGVRSDVDAFLQAMDVFILPSLYEGMPVVAVEAQAAGLPCLVSDVVTQEAKILDSCKYISINNVDMWVEEIEKIDKHRTDTYADIVNSGYDIHTTSKWIEDFYLCCSNNKT